MQHEQPDSGSPLTIRLEHNDAPLELHDPYVDFIWTPIVGSTATAALRVITHLARLGKGTHTTTNELSLAVGCSPARLDKAIERLAHAGLINLSPKHITAYSAVPTASTRCIDKLAPWAITYASNRHSKIRRPA